jgi:hypothetical protein
MRIVAPISRVAEAETLARAGADELYCGVQPREWVGSFGVANANRRPTGNLSGYGELAEAITAAHAANATVTLVMNAQQYGDGQADAVMALAERFLELEGDALIVSDLGLVAALATSLPGARIHVSSVATCRNHEAVRLCGELGARRVILPRDVTLDEACRMAACSSDTEIEAFILNDGCVFEEGSCHTIHLPPGLGGRSAWTATSTFTAAATAGRYGRRTAGHWPATTWSTGSGCGTGFPADSPPPVKLCPTAPAACARYRACGRPALRRSRSLVARAPLPVSWPACAWSAASLTPLLPANLTRRSCIKRRPSVHRKSNAARATCATTRKS